MTSLLETQMDDSKKVTNLVRNTLWKDVKWVSESSLEKRKLRNVYLQTSYFTDYRMP